VKRELRALHMVWKKGEHKVATKKCDVISTL
jgi:hypothetical protein